MSLREPLISSTPADRPKSGRQKSFRTGATTVEASWDRMSAIWLRWLETAPPPASPGRWTYRLWERSA